MGIDIDIIAYSYSIFLYIWQFILGDFEVPAYAAFTSYPFCWYSLAIFRTILPVESKPRTEFMMRSRFDMYCFPWYRVLDLVLLVL